ncbi:IS5/IS1182 family transposase, partial [Ochrobactrum sp. GPK 3]
MIQSDCLDSMELTMTWTVTARRRYVRRNARYATDLTDAEWS